MTPATQQKITLDGLDWKVQKVRLFQWVWITSNKQSGIAWTQRGAIKAATKAWSK